NHFVTPYSALVIPSEAGYAGFKRLAEGDTLTLAKSGPVLPEQFEVRAYPNPFNAQLQITVRMNPLAVDGQVDIRIYDLLGRQVRAWRQNVPAHESSLLLIWDGTDEKSESAGSGVYFVSVQRDHQRQIAKITCLK
ncbi:MAG TPA: T9SS type A sorting domain-containing protein, partial [bacterium]|nr:T9SS type A sorting domain-containing protein [bacterium]